MSRDIIYAVIAFGLAAVMIYALKDIAYWGMNISRHLRKINEKVDSFTDWVMIGYEDGRKLGEKRAYAEIMSKAADMMDQMIAATESDGNATQQ